MEGGTARRAAPLLPEAVRKTLRKAVTTEPEEKEVVTGDSEGDAGGLPNYVPTGGDRRIQVVYRDWVHSKYRSHLSGGITDDQEW